MRRREFLKTVLASALYAGGGLAFPGRVAQAAGFPASGNRMLVNIMLAGAPDFRHLFTPQFDADQGSYGYRYWEARAGSHAVAASSSAWRDRWENDYVHVGDATTEFGILAKCGWLRRMWDAGNVAIISNAMGGTTRNHSHCELIMDQGDLSTGPNDFNRSGWGGRLATYAGGNVLSLTRTPTPFTYGPHPLDYEQHDNSNLISASDTRNIALYKGDDVPPNWPQAKMARSLRSYYQALQQEMPADSIYNRFVDHQRSLREFGEPIEERLSMIPLPASITGLMEGGLANPYLARQIQNLYDSFACSDILSGYVASLELDGWDTHATQRDVIEPKLEDLFGDGKALDTLYSELPPDVQENMIFVMGGEFGRQLRANGDNGTDHGSGTSILVIGNGVNGGVYGDMFPESELERLTDSSPEITGLTTFDNIFSGVCDWIQPGLGAQVFPDRSLSTVEPGVDLGVLFTPQV
jgi:uncharacterized protein (DUF1501 family)